jgi:RNA polymerase sigma-70 factor (ECF subfamily)
MLFEAYKLDIASYCSWRTRSRADAEEAVAEVFLVAWRKLDLVPEGDAARAWLYGTARKVTANTRRSGRRRDALVERVSQQLPFEEEPGMSAEDAAVHEALALLSDQDREVLLLVEWEGLRPAELGDVLGCREVTARGRLHRARARFRDAFESVMSQQSITAEFRKAQP